MSNSLSDREIRLTKRFPVLEKLPEGKRLALAMKAAKHPSVWGTALVVFVLLLPFLARGIFYLQENIKSPIGLALSAGLLGSLCLVILMRVTFYMQGRIIKRLIVSDS